MPLKIGIVGGTGGMGKGFALRWAASNNNHIMIGSRDATRAAEAAQLYKKEAEELFGGDNSNNLRITGGDNLTVAKESDVLVLSIPYQNIDAVCPAILPHISDDCTVISPIVPMTKTDAGFEFIPFMDKDKKTSHEMVAAHMNSPDKLVSAFHVISEKKLVNPNIQLDYDIFVCGDDDGAVRTVTGLITEIKGLRPILLGSGRLAYMAEIATPLLLNAMIKNKMRNPGIKLV